MASNTHRPRSCAVQAQNFSASVGDRDSLPKLIAVPQITTSRVIDRLRRHRLRHLRQASAASSYSISTRRRNAHCIMRHDVTIAYPNDRGKASREAVMRHHSLPAPNISRPRPASAG